ncbi:MAG: hypothetical protein R3F59_23255 [Myxococcota bacterium]
MDHETGTLPTLDGGPVSDAAEDEPTNRLPVSQWLPPVATEGDLPQDNVAEGSLCYVQAAGEEAAWQYRQGEWVCLKK